MHAADIVYLVGLHPWTIGSNDAPQSKHWKPRPVFRQQPFSMQAAPAITAVAGDFEHRQLRGHFAQGDGAAHGFCLV